MKLGRPTDDPKAHQLKVRVSDKDMEMLRYCCEKTGKTQADVIREGIKNTYKKLKRKE